jgi:1,4-dihydroxy-2-naphthoate octaprenyltransferase
MSRAGLPYTPAQIWLLAARPRTLPAAAAPVIVGSAAAFADGGFRLGPALAALAGALLLQIGANLANDVFDFHRGADTAARLGPLRVTQAGLLQPRQVLTGMWLTFLLAALLGVYLAWSGGPAILVIGVLSILAAIAYTGGPWPLGYRGLGDLFVFLFFGPAAVIGTYLVQTRTVSPLAVAASLPMGLLATAILVVNNLRDLDTDRAAGKRTLAVRWGAAGARREYLLLLATAFLIPLGMWAFGLTSAWPLLAWLAALHLPPLLRRVLGQSGRALNPALGDTGSLELLFGLLFALGLVIQTLG